MTTVLHRARRCYWLRWHNSGALPWIPSLGTIEFGTGFDSSCPRKELSSNAVRFLGTVSQGLADALADFRNIAAFPELGKRTEDVRRRVSQAIYDVEYKLILLHQEDREECVISNEDPQRLKDMLFRIVRAAAQIYVFIALREMLGLAPIVRNYAQILESNLEEYWTSSDQINEWSSDARDLLIWTMVLLLLTSPNHKNQLQTAERLTQLLRLAAITDLDKLVLTLKNVAWMDDMLSEELCAIWDKLQLYLQSLQ